MSQLDHPSLLEQLIITGELAIQMRSSRTPEVAGRLLEEVAAEATKPVDGERVIGLDTLIFAQAICGAAAALASYDREPATKYLRVVGVLMPDIRAALATAIEIRKRPTP